MALTNVDPAVFDIDRDYAIYHPDILIVNRMVSERIIGAVSHTVDFNAGKRIGAIIAGKYAAITGRLEFLNACFAILEKSGWGTITFVAERLRVRVKNAPIGKYYAKHEGTADEPIDDILRGIIVALFEAIDACTYEAVETKCVAMGHAYCEFALVAVHS